MLDALAGFMVGVGLTLAVALAVIPALILRLRSQDGHHPVSRWEWGDFSQEGFPMHRGDLFTPESILAIVRWELDRRARPIPTGKEDSDLEEPSHRA